MVLPLSFVSCVRFVIGTRDRSLYTYPSTRSESPSPSHPPSLAVRLRLLQAEVASLETELSDSSNSVVHAQAEEGHVDPGELIQSLVDVKSRLEKFNQKQDGRVKLVKEVLKEEPAKEEAKEIGAADASSVGKEVVGEVGKPRSEVQDLAAMDQRLGEIEKLVGSASTSLDEVRLSAHYGLIDSLGVDFRIILTQASPMPPPLLPLLTRLNTQLTVLTQPRHLDNISRRLKLLLTDLDRASSTNPHQRKSSHHADSSSSGAPPPSALQEQITPILTRLVPSLPHIPHILTRLRTLSTLHTSAAEFQTTLEGLEEEDKKVSEALEELSKAVDDVERSLEDNGNLVKGNVSSLEGRIDALMERLEKVSM